MLATNQFYNLIVSFLLKITCKLLICAFLFGKQPEKNLNVPSEACNRQRCAGLHFVAILTYKCHAAHTRYDLSIKRTKMNCT